jgi:hypothetical protein
MQVLSCDAVTREFYGFKGILLEADKEVVAMVREIPKYNGFDSLDQTTLQNKQAYSVYSLF